MPRHSTQAARFPARVNLPSNVIMQLAKGQTVGIVHHAPVDALP